MQRRRPKQRFCFSSQERGASARRGSVTHSQWRRVLRTDQVCTADSALRTTAGLRQPLLVHDVRSLHKAPFAMHKRTFIRAAGVSPPGFGEPHVVPRESNIVRRLANTQPGAVGVSPPWFRFALTTVIVFCGVITFRTAHSLPAPRLADAPRSWCRANVCR
jgi:hypothetical protein